MALALIRSIPDNGYIQSGNAILKGKDILNIPAKVFDEIFRWKDISMIFQGSMNSLDPVFSIENQMKEILKVHKIKDDHGSYDKIIKNTLSEVGLDPAIVAKRYQHELSGGMKQRVVIANALLLEPSILIADEPTTALDVITQSHIITLLKNMKKTKKMKIILITHDLSLIPNIVDKVVIMYAGQAIEISDIKTIYGRPLHPYTQDLIKSIPNINSASKNRSQSITKGSADPSSIKEGCKFRNRCPYVMDICKNTPPDFNIEGNIVKCWLYDEKQKLIDIQYK